MKHTAFSRIHIAGKTVGLLVLCFCPACKQAPSTDTASTQVSASPLVTAQASAAAPSSSVSSAQTGSACSGNYQGEYTVSPVKPALSRKEGAPEQWEKDDGTTLAGKGTLTLQVDSNNVVSGSAQGALGPQTLRGLCDETALRVQLDSAGDQLGKIQNAYFVADITGNQGAGTLAAATGDSLLRRSGPITVRRVQ